MKRTAQLCIVREGEEVTLTIILLIGGSPVSQLRIGAWTVKDYLAFIHDVANNPYLNEKVWTYISPSIENITLERTETEEPIEEEESRDFSEEEWPDHIGD